MKTMIKALMGLAVGLTSAAAYAYTDTPYFFIGRLEASSGTSGSYRVYPAQGYTLPQICGNNDFAEGHPSGPSLKELELMDHLLMSAFLANRRVKLRLDGCDATDDRPLFRIVTVHMDQ